MGTNRSARLVSGSQAAQFYLGQQEPPGVEVKLVGSFRVVEVQVGVADALVV